MNTMSESVFNTFWCFIFNFSFDDNNDGTIDMKEMKKFAKDINILLDAGENEAMKDKAQVKDTFNVWDQNSDGKITEDEFVQAVMNHDKIATMLTLKIIDILSHDSEEDQWSISKNCTWSKNANTFLISQVLIFSSLGSHQVSWFYGL